MIYKENESVPANALADLRQAVGWNRMEDCYRNPSMMSYYHIAVYDGNALIAYIDCVSNTVTDAYIQDLMVHPDYQGKGIGTKLMERMIGYLQSKHIYMISVIIEESLKPFYDRFGFTHMLSGQLETFACK